MEKNQEIDEGIKTNITEKILGFQINNSFKIL